MAKRQHSPSHSPTSPSQRQRRAGELVKHVLAEIFQREEVHGLDIPTQLITISEVKASPDLRNATVYCSVLGQADAAETVAALNAAATKIRGVLAGKIDLKYTPALHFSEDDRFEEAARIDALLAAAQRNHD